MDSSIPVCTLFKRDSLGDLVHSQQEESTTKKTNPDQNNAATFLDTSINSNVCDVFKNSPSTEDLFESILNVSENDSTQKDSIENPNLNETSALEIEEGLPANTKDNLFVNIKKKNDGIGFNDNVMTLQTNKSLNVSKLSEVILADTQPEKQLNKSQKNLLESLDIFDENKNHQEAAVSNNSTLFTEDAVAKENNQPKTQETNLSFGENVVKVPMASELFPLLDNDDGADCLFKNFDKSCQPENDAFTSALNNSETCRRRDAWIPKETTAQVLSTVARTQKRIKLETSYLIRPGLVTSETLGDPVKAVLVKFKGIEFASTRETLNVESVSFDQNGFCKLIDTGNLRAAVNLTGRALSNLGQGFGKSTQPSENTEISLKWWYVRLSLLIRLKLFDIAESELLQFGDLDSANLYYGFYPDLYPGRKGSMVSFSFRLLHANFHRHKQQPQKSLSELYSVKAICLKILKNLDTGKSEDGKMVLKEDDKCLSITLWKQRVIKVMYSIGNTLLQMKEYHVAFKTFDEIVQLNPSDAVVLGSGVGRAMLQLGDIRAAKQRFASIEKLVENDPPHKFQVLLNRGFLYVGANNWKEALLQFDEALKLKPTNIEALSNKAVCLLYLCRLKDAIFTLENAVKLRMEQEDVSVSSQISFSNSLSFEGALSNLVTLYELESSRFMAKKQLLLQHVSRISGDGFDVSCLKM